jgi:glycosyltransferase involved in cell wall biosynthesis
MRILRVIRSANPAGGGPIEGVKQSSSITQKEGHIEEVVSLDPPEEPWLRDFPLPVHALGTSSTGYGYAPGLIAWMREHRNAYDAVIVHGIWQYQSYATWRALRHSDTPYFVFPHGMLDPWFKRTYPLKHLKKWLYWPWSDYRVLRDAAGVFFTCERERQLARESFWLYRCNEVVTRYGTAGIPCPTKDYAQAFLTMHPALEGKRRFLFFGRVHTKKGPDVLIEAVANLQRLGVWDPSEMRLVMAGPADSDYAAKLKKLASEQGLSESIYWTGSVFGDEKWGAIQSAEVFVLPSHQENFGIAVAEALSAGVPVLISHAVNISPEIAEDGAGFADTDDVDGCCRMLQRWIELPEEERARMRTQARATFENRYTAASAAADLVKHVASCIKSEGGTTKLTKTRTTHELR